MLAPLRIATSRSPPFPSRAAQALRPATARAPAGSITLRVSSKTSLIAAQISSFVTRTTPSTHSRAMRNVSSPTSRTATPSAKMPTRSRWTRFPASSERYMASASKGSTPIDLHPRHHRLQVAGHPGDEPSPADRHEDGVHPPVALPQDLLADRALAGDHQRVVERVDEREAGLGDEPVAVGLRLRVAVAGQHDLGAHRPHRLDLDLGRRLRHDDDRPQAEVAGRVRDALRVVAGARRDHPAGPLGVAHVGDAVVGPAQLEAEDGLQVLPLEEDLRREPARQARGGVERRLAGHVVDAAREHVVQQRSRGAVAHVGERADYAPAHGHVNEPARGDPRSASCPPESWVVSCITCDTTDSASRCAPPAARRG